MLKEKLTAEIKTAMREKNKSRLQVLRGVTAAIKQKEVDERITIDSDEPIITILGKMVKQRKDSISEFVKANRLDLAENETYEVTILEEFLPKKLSEAEALDVINSIVAEVKPETMRDMGKVMGVIKSKYNGLIDPAFASAKVKEVINNQ